MQRPKPIIALAVLLFFASSDLNAQEEVAPQPAKILRLALRGQVFEGEPPFELFSSKAGVSLRKLTQRIQQAARDDRIAALVLGLRSPLMDWVQLQSLRRELLRFRASGKPSHCHLMTAGTGAYLLASACSDVALHPTGEVQIPGLQMGLVFLRDLFAKVGIHFQELRMGRFKSSAEGFTRNEPSGPSRESINSMIDHLFAELVDTLAENRDLKPIEVRALIDHAFFNAEEAREKGLVDHVEYRDEFYARIRKQGEQELALEDAKFGQDLNLEISGFMGFMKLFNEILGVGKHKVKSTEPKLAIINAVGPIMDDAWQGGLFGSPGVTANAMRKVFEEVREDDSIKAVVFRVNSPGGSALASDRILRQVQLTAHDKPVIVSMGHLAASGGYYISCRANRIFAERGTLTGSIGVIGAIPNIKELFDKVGVNIETFSRGKRAELVSPYGELTDEGRRLLMKMLEEIYDDFIEHVAAGRKLSRDAVLSVAEGRVWTGQQALELGLVDRIGGLEAAIDEARQLAGIDSKAAIVSYPKPKTFMDVLQGDVRMPGVSTLLLESVIAELPFKVREALRYFRPFAGFAQQRVLTLMPAVFVFE